MIIAFFLGQKEVETRKSDLKLSFARKIAGDIIKRETEKAVTASQIVDEVVIYKNDGVTAVESFVIVPEDILTLQEGNK